MRKVVFVIDGWFMRKRIYKLKSFLYTGPGIREYCRKHLRADDQIYRIFYYDTEPLDKKIHNPLKKKLIDYSKTTVATKQKELFQSIKETPNFALRLGSTAWRKGDWAITPTKFKELLNKNITIDDLQENDIHPIIRQKAVDMKMGLDIALVAMKRLADVLIVITGDADIVPVLKFARREGMMVGIDPLQGNIMDDLREHVDFIQSFIQDRRPSSKR